MLKLHYEVFLIKLHNYIFLLQVVFCKYKHLNGGGHKNLTDLYNLN